MRVSVRKCAMPACWLLSLCRRPAVIFSEERERGGTKRNGNQPKKPKFFKSRLLSFSPGPSGHGESKDFLQRLRLCRGVEIYHWWQVAVSDFSLRLDHRRAWLICPGY